MKTIIMSIVAFLCVLPLFSQENYTYNNGNGTILKIEYVGNLKMTYRKHEQRLNHYDNLTVFDKPNGRELFVLKYNEYINIFELVIEENIIERNIKCWLRIKDDNKREGWVYCDNDDPYANGLGSFLGIIDNGGEKWTILKIGEKKLYAVNGLNVRDKPGLRNTKVIFQFRYSGQYMMDEYREVLGVTIIAKTKEKETVNDESLTVGDKTYCWIKIRDKDNREGWVFGGYLDQGNRGGPKFWDPETRISLVFMYP